jgi:hypothetical protein
MATQVLSGRSRSDAPLLERGPHLLVLGELAAAAAAGEARLAIVEGRSGAARRACWSRVGALARAERLQVCLARGGELEGGFTFGVVRQLFEPLLAAGGGEDLLTGAAGIAAPMFADAGDRRRCQAAGPGSAPTC